jgi:hypothetical protein
LLAGNTAKNSIKKQKAKAGWAEEVRWGRGGGVCERKLGRAGGGTDGSSQGAETWQVAICCLLTTFNLIIAVAPDVFTFGNSAVSPPYRDSYRFFLVVFFFFFTAQDTRSIDPLARVEDTDRSTRTLARSIHSELSIHGQTDHTRPLHHSLILRVGLIQPRSHAGDFSI